MSDNLKWFIAVAVFVCGLFFTSMERYNLISLGNAPIIYRIDKLTGQTWVYCYDDKSWTQINEK